MGSIIGLALDRLINATESRVRCAPMSGLSHGCCRWPSWVCACVSGTKPQSVLKAQSVFRYRLSCL